MSWVRVLLAVTALALGVAGAAGPAQAAAPGPNPLADCNATGTLTHQYSTAALQHALATMPADVREYSDCYDVIQRALLAQVSAHRDGGAGGPGGSGGSFLPTPVIVVLALLALAAATLGALALRRRAGGGRAETP